MDRFGLAFHCQIKKYIKRMDKNNRKLKIVYKCITLFAILYESNTEGTNFWIVFTCFGSFTFVKCVLYCIQNSVRFNLEKIPVVTLFG